jgi:peroxiredoxin
MTSQPIGELPVAPLTRDSLRRIAGPPSRWLHAGLALLTIVALALAIATRVSTGAQAVDHLIGRPAPAFSLPVEAHGHSLPTNTSLAALRGRPALLVFFYTLCTHCLGELGTVRDVAAAHADSGLQPLYIDSPAEPPAIPDAYLTRAQIDTPVLLDGGAQVAAAYGIRFYPALVLVDANGTVRATWTGEASAAALDVSIRRLSG